MADYRNRLNAALGVALRRQYETPLDVSTVFLSIADLEAYVKRDKTYFNPNYTVEDNEFLQKINPYSYPGQVVAVIDQTDNTATAYIIESCGERGVYKPLTASGELDDLGLIQKVKIDPELISQFSNYAIYNEIEQKIKMIYHEHIDKEFWLPNNDPSYKYYYIVPDKSKITRSRILWTKKPIPTADLHMNVTDHQPYITMLNDYYISEEWYEPLSLEVNDVWHAVMAMSASNPPHYISWKEYDPENKFNFKYYYNAYTGDIDPFPFGITNINQQITYLVYHPQSGKFFNIPVDYTQEEHKIPYEKGHFPEGNAKSFYKSLGFEEDIWRIEPQLQQAQPDGLRFKYWYKINENDSQTLNTTRISSTQEESAIILEKKLEPEVFISDANQEISDNQIIKEQSVETFISDASVIDIENQLINENSTETFLK